MKPQLLKINRQPVSSLSVRRDMSANINCRWHYHRELELIYFHKGSGVQFVGDNIRNFSAGDVILLGPDLPHYWMYNEDRFSENDSAPYASVIHFEEDFLGKKFLDIPESRKIRALLENARQGLFFPAGSAVAIRKLIEQIYESSGLKRIVSLLQCLETCAENEHSSTLASKGFRYHIDPTSSDRLSNVYKFTYNNFRGRIELKDVAEISGFTTNSFCRYFKSRTGKTYYRFLTEVRIGYACKLLLDNSQSLKQISFDSGFQNFSSFHTNFKQITGFTPHAYQSKYINA